MRALAQSANPPLLAAAFVLLMVRLPLSGLRWRLLLERHGYTFSTWYLTRITFTAQAAGIILPGASGIDIVRGLSLARAGGAPRHVVETVLAERAIGVFSLILMSCPSGFWVIVHDSPLVNVSWAVLAVAVVSAAVIAVAPRLPMLVASSTGEDGVWSSVRGVVMGLRDVVAHRGLLGKLLGLSMMYQLAGIVSVYLTGLAIGGTVPFVDYVLCLPPIWLWMMAPVSLAGLGLREGGFVYFFGLAGMPIETAVTLSLLTLALMLAQAGLAGIFLLVPMPTSGATEETP